MTRTQRPFPIEKLFSALSDRTRLRLLNLMSGQDICVCYLVEVLQTNQPKISRHLAYLRNAGIVVARREGKWMHYRLTLPSDPAAARILKEVQRQLAGDKTMQQDKRRLTKACCAPQKFVRLSHAPLPATVSDSRAEHATAVQA
jgi:ArsR family transcriptional regulator